MRKIFNKDDIDVVIDGFFSAKQKLNYLLYRMHKPSAVLSYCPITISAVSTGRCTLICDMCPTHSKKMPKDYKYAQNPTRDMGFDIFKYTCDRFDRALYVNIIGSGEPMLNKDFFAMAEYASKGKRMRVKTFTNGTTVDANIDRILGSYLDGITISLNGHSREEYSRMTGADGGTFDVILNAAGKLVSERNRRKSRIKIKVSFIIDKVNYKNIPDMIAMGLNLGADTVFLCNFLPAPCAGSSAGERMLLKTDGKIADEIKKMYNTLNAETRKKVLFPYFVDGTMPFNNCSSHFTQLRVDGEGRVSSCSIMLLDMEGHGHIKDEEVWNNKFFREMREKFLSNDKNRLSEPCRVCPENCGVMI